MGPTSPIPDYPATQNTQHSRCMDRVMYQPIGDPHCSTCFIGLSQSGRRTRLFKPIWEQDGDLLCHTVTWSYFHICCYSSEVTDTGELNKSLDQALLQLAQPAVHISSFIINIVSPFSSRGGFQMLMISRNNWVYHNQHRGQFSLGS